MSKMADAAEVEAEKAKRKQAGLDAVLASLQGAKKVNVLDKSRNDWTTFKSADAQVSLSRTESTCFHRTSQCSAVWGVSIRGAAVGAHGGWRC